MEPSEGPQLQRQSWDHLLSDPELSVLMKGLNFAVTPQKVPVAEIVTATESACRSLDSGDVHGLRAKVVQLLDRQDKVKDQNVTRKEWEAIDKLKKDDAIIVLPAEKCHVTVEMKKENYLQKT